MSYYGSNHYKVNHYGSTYYGPQGEVVPDIPVPIRGGGAAEHARRKQLEEDDLIMQMVMDKFQEIINAT